MHVIIEAEHVFAHVTGRYAQVTTALSVDRTWSLTGRNVTGR